MKALYYQLFYAIYRANPLTREPGTNRWRALIFLTLVQSWIIASATFWALVHVGVAYVQASPWIGLGVYGGLVAVNWHFILRRDSWKAYAERYERYSGARRAVITAVAWIFILGSFLLMGKLVFALDQWRKAAAL